MEEDGEEEKREKWVSWPRRPLQGRHGGAGARGKQMSGRHLCAFAPKLISFLEPFGASTASRSDAETLTRTTFNSIVSLSTDHFTLKKCRHISPPFIATMNKTLSGEEFNLATRFITLIVCVLMFHGIRVFCDRHIMSGSH